MYICIYLVYIYIQPNNLSFDLFRLPTTSLLLSSQAHGDAHRQHAFGAPGHIAPGSSVADGLPVGHDFLQLLADIKSNNPHLTGGEKMFPLEMADLI